MIKLLGVEPRRPRSRTTRRRSTRSRSRDGVASTTALAGRLGVSAPAVSAMVKKLDGLGYVKHLPYRGVRLTDEGRGSRSRCCATTACSRPTSHEELGVRWDQRPRRGGGARARPLRGARGADRGQARRADARSARRPDPAVDGTVVEMPTALDARRGVARDLRPRLRQRPGAPARARERDPPGARSRGGVRRRPVVVAATGTTCSARGRPSMRARG